MAGRPIEPLKLGPDDLQALKKCLVHGSPEEIERVHIVLSRADGLSQEQTAKKLNCSLRRVSTWTQRFQREGIEGLCKKPRRQPKSTRHPEPDASSKNLKTQDPPTLRTVARAAAVSAMTVSRVLSNHPRVHPKTRKQVLEAIRITGYRPDPEMGKLMSRLRKRKVRRLQGAICSLEADSWGKVAYTNESDGYFRSVVAGAKARAGTLGFAWESYSLEAFLANPSQVLRMLYHRGTDGILLPPPPIPLGMHSSLSSADIGWINFSIVTTSYGIDAPMFRRVVPDQFGNIKICCSALWQKGCRRIGLAIPRTLDERVLQNYSGGFVAFHLAKKSSMPAPFLYDTTEERRSRLGTWFKRERPDALIVSSGKTAREIAQQLTMQNQHENLPIAALALLEHDTAGIDLRPERVGSTAVETLGSMIIHHERGPAADPPITLVPGRWRE